MYVCMDVRVYVCGGLPAYFVILIARGRPPPLFQSNSAPSLSLSLSLAPPHTVPRPFTPCSPHPFLCASSSCSTRRHPSENLRLSDNLQSHVFSRVSAPTVIYELSQICIRVTYPSMCTSICSFPVYRCLFLIAAVGFLVSLRRATFLSESCILHDIVVRTTCLSRSVRESNSSTMQV